MALQPNGFHFRLIPRKVPGGLGAECSLLLSQGRLAAQRVLADRQHVLLDADAQQEWERINSRPARSLPGLTRLLERPSPFAKPAADQPQP